MAPSIASAQNPRSHDLSLALTHPSHKPVTPVKPTIGPGGEDGHEDRCDAQGEPCAIGNLLEEIWSVQCIRIVCREKAQSC